MTLILFAIICLVGFVRAKNFNSEIQNVSDLRNFVNDSENIQIDGQSSFDQTGNYLNLIKSQFRCKKVI